MLTLRLALAVNGAAMLAWSPFLFFKHRSIISAAEGRKAAAKKTPFDDMIWQITGLWVAFTGLTCLFVTDVPSVVWSTYWDDEISPETLTILYHPLAFLISTIHIIETFVKWNALGKKGVLQGASGNIVLAGLLLVAITFS